MTPRVDTAFHRVTFTLRKGKVHVGCICRTRAPETENSKDGSRSVDPIGPSVNLEESRVLYDNPDNHWAPFDPEKDKAKW